MLVSAIYCGAHHCCKSSEKKNFSQVAMITVVSIQILLLAVALALHFKGAKVKSVVAVASGTVISELVLAIYLPLRKANLSDPFLEEGGSLDFMSAIKRLDNKKMSKEISGVYVLSNESGIDHSIQVIEEEGERCDALLKAHLGVGALHNFDIMAARRSDYGVLFDFNPNNKKFIDQCLCFIRESDRAEDFVEKISGYMALNKQEYNHYKGYASPIDRMQAELARASSWLGDEGKFQHIKKMVVESKIVAITQDFRQVVVFRHLMRIMQQQGCVIDTLYLSNIYSYLSLEEFYVTFDILAGSKPLVIHCTPPDSCQCEAGCCCSKAQNISRLWMRVSKKEGAIKPIVL